MGLDYNVYTSLHFEAHSYRYWSYWNTKQYLLLVTELYCIFILLLKNVKSFLGDLGYKASWIMKNIAIGYEGEQVYFEAEVQALALVSQGHSSMKI